MTQVLTEHGCFGEYLCRIKKEDTTHCHHCDAARDTAQYTLAECPAWDVLRQELVRHVGADLSLPVLVEQMTGSEETWKAVASFCEAVMLQKEEAAAEVAAAAAAVAAGSGSEGGSEADEGEVEVEDGDEWANPTSPASPPPRRLRRRRRSPRRAPSPLLGR